MVQDKVLDAWKVNFLLNKSNLMLITETQSLRPNQKCNPNQAPGDDQLGRHWVIKLAGGWAKHSPFFQRIASAISNMKWEKRVQITLISSCTMHRVANKRLQSSSSSCSDDQNNDQILVTHQEINSKWGSLLPNEWCPSLPYDFRNASDASQDLEVTSYKMEKSCIC